MFDTMALLAGHTCTRYAGRETYSRAWFIFVLQLLLRIHLFCKNAQRWIRGWDSVTPRVISGWGQRRCDEVVGTCKRSLGTGRLLSFGAALEDNQELVEGWHGGDNDTDILFHTGGSLIQGGRNYNGMYEECSPSPNPIWNNVPCRIIRYLEHYTRSQALTSDIIAHETEQDGPRNSGSCCSVKKVRMMGVLSGG